MPFRRNVLLPLEKSEKPLKCYSGIAFIMNYIPDIHRNNCIFKKIFSPSYTSPLTEENIILHACIISRHIFKIFQKPNSLEKLRESFLQKIF